MVKINLTESFIKLLVFQRSVVITSFSFVSIWLLFALPPALNKNVAIHFAEKQFVSENNVEVSKFSKSLYK